MMEPATPEDRTTESAPSVTNVSGGVNVTTDHMNVGGDVIARDKITQYIRNIKIDLRLLPVVAVLLAVIGVMGYLLLRPTHPDKMTAEFNVAVAELAVVDQNGAPVSSPDGKNLADFIYQRLGTQFKELNLEKLNYELWPPDYTGHIEGRSAEERATAVAELADHINADVIVYGVLTQSGDRSQFTPEYFVNYKGFAQSPELTGQHAMGSSLRVVLPFKLTELADVENPALSARASALSLITIGLAYYSIDQFDHALDYFHQAEQIKGWLNSAGKEIVYLLIGNAQLQIASKDKTTAPLAAATQAYTTALEINPQYARAAVGQASVLYLEALPDAQNINANTVDNAKLAAAENAYETARSLKDTPPTANLSTKIEFGLGQIYLVRAQLRLDDALLAQARAAFETIIRDYQTGNTTIADFAGQAYARLGLIARTQKDFPTAIENYQQAIKLVSPAYQATYNASLGEVYVEAGDTTKAVEAYTEAVRIAEFYGDDANAEKYGQRLKQLH